MEQFERFLDYEKQIAEFKLKTINRFQKGFKPKLQKRTSKAEIVEHVLRIAGRPLHISEILQIADRDFHVPLERDSIVSILIKKISLIVLQFRECFSRAATFQWFVIVIMGFIIRVDHHGVSSII